MPALLSYAFRLNCLLTLFKCNLKECWTIFVHDLSHFKMLFSEEIIFMRNIILNWNLIFGGRQILILLILFSARQRETLYLNLIE